MFFVQEGFLKLAVGSHEGKEALVAILKPNDFFGEGCLEGHAVRMSTAISIARSTLVRFERTTMLDLLRDEAMFLELFMSHLLSRNTKLEEHLADQLLNCSEKRLARALLSLADSVEAEGYRVNPKINQETLAAMIGTTRPRVSYFMSKFKRLGCVDDKGEWRVNTDLLSGVLRS